MFLEGNYFKMFAAVAMDYGNRGALKCRFGVFPHHGYHSNPCEHFRIISLTKSLLNHSRNMCRKFQYSNSITLGKDRFLRLKNSVLR